MCSKDYNVQDALIYYKHVEVSNDDEKCTRHRMRM